MRKISTIAFAQGFIEDYIESETEPIKIEFEWKDEAKQDASEQNEHREQVRNMWKVVSEGLDQLRRENQSLQNRIALVQQALNTPT